MSKYETPSYDVVENHGRIELRHYSTFILIKYDTAKDPYNNHAFETLFRYIQTENEDQAQIKMTVPVIQEFQNGKLTMAFVLPQKHILAPPLPLNSALHVEKFIEGDYAVIRFKGPQSIRNLRQHQTELLQWIKENDYEMLSDVMGAFYNPPLIPPFLRRNELLVRIVKRKLA